MNQISLIGRLTKDIELSQTNNGKSVTNFTLAVNRNFKNSQGEREADFINCQAWGKQAELLANYLSKGSQLGLVGRIQTRNYENQNGQRVYVTEVVTEDITFINSQNNSDRDVKNNQMNNNNANFNKNDYNWQNSANNSNWNNTSNRANISDDSLPF